MPNSEKSQASPSLLRYKIYDNERKRVIYVYSPLFVATKKRINLPKPILKRTTADEIEYLLDYEKMALIGRSLV